MKVLPKKTSAIIYFFIFLLAVYGILTLIIFPFFAFDDWNILKTLKTERMSEINGAESKEISIPGGLFISFAASAIQDILFFLIVGILLVVYSIRRPEDDKLAQKIDYLFPEVKDDPTIKAYLSDEISKLGCISTKTIMTFNIQEYKSDISAFKAQTHYESHLKNMHNKDKYSNPKLAMKLKSDLTCPAPNDLYGQLEYVKVHMFEDGSISDAVITKDIYPVNMATKDFTHGYEYTIAPHAVALFDAKHWAWSPESISHFFRVSRFTKNVGFRCINNTGHDIEISIKQISTQDAPDIKVLTNSECHTGTLLNLTPGDGFELVAKRN